jgi:hypothetical protein
VKHLNPEELVDLAEGTRPESSAPHLESCAACREQLADARAMLSAVADVEVPEPSPLFWDHLSDRVRQAVAVEPEPRRSWIGALSWQRLLMPAVSLAMAALVVGVMLNGRATTPSGGAGVALAPSAAVADAHASRDLLADAPGSAEDPSLMLVAELSGDLDWDRAGEAGLAGAGSAEHAVTHMNDKELLELRRLLAEELAHSGA